MRIWKKCLCGSLAMLLITALIGCGLAQKTTLETPTGSTRPTEATKQAEPPAGITETQPQPVETGLPTEVVPTDEESPEKREPKPTEPAPFQKPAPKPTEPPATEVPTEPPVTEPKPTEPKPTEPKPTAPPATEPKPTAPPTTEPKPTQPPATEPPITEPSETDPPAEKLDLDALEAYGRSYASSTYGYKGSPGTGFSSNAGYYPPSRLKITSMEEGKRCIRELVDSQYRYDVASGNPITAEIDGVTVRMKINIYIAKTDDPDVYLLYCFYGGK